jgi:hypothetical protein
MSRQAVFVRPHAVASFREAHASSCVLVGSALFLGMSARRRMIRALLTGAIAQGLCLSVASAQNGCTPPQPDDADLLKEAAELFTTAQHAQFRSDQGLRTLDDSATRTVITDARTCIAIYHGIYANVDRMWKLQPGVSRRTALAVHTIHYFRVGAYYVAMLVPNARSNDARDVVIFEKCDWCVIEGSLRYRAGIVIMW